MIAAMPLESVTVVPPSVTVTGAVLPGMMPPGTFARAFQVLAGRIRKIAMISRGIAWKNNAEERLNMGVWGVSLGEKGLRDTALSRFRPWRKSSTFPPPNEQFLHRGDAGDIRGQRMEEPSYG